MSSYPPPLINVCSSIARGSNASAALSRDYWAEGEWLKQWFRLYYIAAEKSLTNYFYR